MMGSERVVGARSSSADDDEPAEVSGIVPQSLVELFRLLEERAEAGSGQEDDTETWSVRVGYLQVGVGVRRWVGRCVLVGEGETSSSCFGGKEHYTQRII